MPYRIDAALRPGAGRPALVFANRSQARAAVFHVYNVVALADGPARYTVGAGAELSHPVDPSGAEDLFVIGPNGFHRRLRGRADRFSAALVEQDRAGATRAWLDLRNLTAQPLSVALADRAYGAAAQTIALAAGEARRIRLDHAHSHGWYDWQLTSEGQVWRMAGHIEDGADSFSDPVAGGPGPLRLG